MERNPSGSAKAVSNGIVHGHVGGEARPVVDVGGLAVGRVGAAHVVVVPAQNNGAEFAAPNGLVEGGRNGNSAHAVGIENPCLRPHHQSILLGLLDPAQVVLHLHLNVFGRLCGQGAQNVGGDAVGSAQVVGGSAGADPTKRTKSVVKTHGPKNVLHVAWVGEVDSVLGEYVGSGSAGFQQKSIAVVKEVHAAGVQNLNRSYVTAQRRLDFGAKALGILGH